MTESKPLKGIEITAEGLLRFLEQTKLPTEVSYLETGHPELIIRAIRQLDIRGAPAIALAGIFAIVVWWRREVQPDMSSADRYSLFSEVAANVCATRKTAVNLRNATRRLDAVFQSLNDGTRNTTEIFDGLMQEVGMQFDEDEKLCERIALHGVVELQRLGEGKPLTIVTHCNTGALATAGIGTAIGVIVRAHERGLIKKVYVTTTPPLYQGARLTAVELRSHGIEVELTFVEALAMLRTKTEIDCAIVGADRIGRHGQVANKVGTAVLASVMHDPAFGPPVPLYVAAPMTTFDMEWVNPSLDVEQRSPDEVRRPFGVLITDPDVPVYSPAFDVMPCSHVDGYVTDQGLFANPEEFVTIIKN